MMAMWWWLLLRERSRPKLNGDGSGGMGPLWWNGGSGHHWLTVNMDACRCLKQVYKALEPTLTGLVSTSGRP